MSDQDQDQPTNFGADATENNLAGTRDEFHDEVTAQLLDEAEEHKKSEENEEESDGGGADEREEREEQPALEVDEESPASEAKPSS